MIIFIFKEFIGNIIETILSNITNIRNIYLRDFGNISSYLDQIYLSIMKYKKKLKQIEIFDFSNTFFEP